MEKMFPRAIAVAITALLVGGLSGSGVAGAGVPRKDRYRARVAAHWLTGQQAADGSVGAFSLIGSTADAVQAWGAARRAPEEIAAAVSYLRANEAEIDTVGETAKVVIALVVAGVDLRSFEGRDLAAEIEATLQPNGRYGEGTPVFDHATAILALLSAGRPIDEGAVAWLVAAQCPDGGWQYDGPHSSNEDQHCGGDPSSDFFTSETDTTSLAIQALKAVPGDEALAANPIKFLRRTRDPVKGGWGYNQAFPLTSANSTALALQAFRAAGKFPPPGAKASLRKLQYGICSKKQGAFAFSWHDENGDGRYTKRERTGPDAGATMAAIPGLLEKALPVRYRDITRSTKPASC